MSLPKQTIMRTPICDINMFPPSPRVSALVMENTNLKASNKTLMYVGLGIVVVGLVGLAFYLRNERRKEEEETRRRSKKSSTENTFKVN